MLQAVKSLAARIHILVQLVQVSAPAIIVKLGLRESQAGIGIGVGEAHVAVPNCSKLT